MSTETGSPPRLASPSVSRRDILVAGAALLVCPGAAMALPAPRVTREWDLFVFRPQDARTLVLAVVSPQDRTRSQGGGFDVRFHAGGMTRQESAMPPAYGSAMSERGDYRCFAGEVIAGASRPTAIYDAVVLEVPAGLDCVGEDRGAWAEILGEDGSRSRVGSPSAAALLARDPSLSDLYHGSSPADDRALFGDALADCIATLAASHGIVADPEAHALRLVDHILPDVIEYRTDAPVGFSFASRNGRHPADDAAAVAMTMLAGAAVPRRAPAPFSVTKAFPYFTQRRIGA